MAFNRDVFHKSQESKNKIKKMEDTQKRSHRKFQTIVSDDPEFQKAKVKFDD